MEQMHLQNMCWIQCAQNNFKFSILHKSESGFKLATQLPWTCLIHHSALILCGRPEPAPPFSILHSQTNHPITPVASVNPTIPGLYSLTVSCSADVCELCQFKSMIREDLPADREWLTQLMQGQLT